MWSLRTEEEFQSKIILKYFVLMVTFSPYLGFLPLKYLLLIKVLSVLKVSNFWSILQSLDQFWIQQETVDVLILQLRLESGGGLLDVGDVLVEGELGQLGNVEEVGEDVGEELCLVRLGEVRLERRDWRDWWRCLSLCYRLSAVLSSGYLPANISLSPVFVHLQTWSWSPRWSSLSVCRGM